MSLGRNDLCHCGSKKKYKFCHLEADQERQRLAGNIENPLEIQDPNTLPTWKLFGFVFLLISSASLLLYALDFPRLAGAVFGCSLLCLIVYSAFRNVPTLRKKPGNQGNIDFGN